MSPLLLEMRFLHELKEQMQAETSQNFVRASPHTVQSGRSRCGIDSEVEVGTRRLWLSHRVEENGEGTVFKAEEAAMQRLTGKSGGDPKQR